MNKVRLGIIGLGGIGKVHFLNSLLIKNARLVAVADVSKKALKFAKKYGIKKPYTNSEKLLTDPEIDAVIISVPNFLHADLAIRALEEGKHVFVEKPLARNFKEGEKIARVAKKKDVKIMVGHQHRFDYGFSKLKQLVENGRIGKVETAIGDYVFRGPFLGMRKVPEWYLDPQMAGGGVLITVGCHLIDLLRWFLGEISKVTYSYLDYKYNLAIEDKAIVHLKFKNNATGVINTGFYSEGMKIDITLYGTAGIVSSSSFNMPVKSVVFRNFFSALRARFLGKQVMLENSYFKELFAFVECIINDKESPIPIADELAVLKVIDEAYALGGLK